MTSELKIERSREIDLQLIENESGRVRLVVEDAMGWDDEQRHLELLQEKLNAYLRYVESGELTQRFPECAGRSVDIDIVLMEGPPPRAMSILQQSSTARPKSFLGSGI